MTKQVSTSGMMETNMKESIKTATSMAKVREKLFIYELLIRTLVNDSTGKVFWNNGDRFEG